LFVTPWCVIEISLCIVARLISVLLRAAAPLNLRLISIAACAARLVPAVAVILSLATI